MTGTPHQFEPIIPLDKFSFFGNFCKIVNLARLFIHKLKTFKYSGIVKDNQTCKLTDSYTFVVRQAQDKVIRVYFFIYANKNQNRSDYSHTTQFVS